MKVVIYFALLFAAAAASPAINLKADHPSCPAPSGMMSICMFVKGYNCVADSDCKDGTLCCSEGCGKACKKPTGGVQLTKNNLICPPSNGMAGICVFIPGVNCLKDSECGNGKLCCSQGCGRVCKAGV